MSTTPIPRDDRGPVRRQWLGRHVAQRRLRLPALPCHGARALGVARGHARVRSAATAAGDRSRGRRRRHPAGRYRASMPVRQRRLLRDRRLSAGAANAVTRPTPENHRKALKTIPHVKLPDRSGVRRRWAADAAVEVVRLRWASDAKGRGPPEATTSCGGSDGPGKTP